MWSRKRASSGLVCPGVIGAQFKDAVVHLFRFLCPFSRRRRGSRRPRTSRLTYQRSHQPFHRVLSLKVETVTRGAARPRRRPYAARGAAREPQVALPAHPHCALAACSVSRLYVLQFHSRPQHQPSIVSSVVNNNSLPSGCSTRASSRNPGRGSGRCSSTQPHTMASKAGVGVRQARDVGRPPA